MKRKFFWLIPGILWPLAAVLMFLNYLRVGTPIPLIATLVLLIAGVRSWVRFFRKD